MPPVLTVEGVERFAVPEDGQRVVVVELVVELVQLGVRLPGLRRTGAQLRRVMLLTGVIGVTALGTDGKRAELGVCVAKTDPFTVFPRANMYVSGNILSSGQLSEINPE